MKELNATITLDDGTRKAVTVYLDDITYSLLMQSGDQALIEAYAADEYNARNLARRENRHGISLDMIAEKGHQFSDKRETPIESVLRHEQQKHIAVAFQQLSDRQRKILVAHLVDGQTLEEIAAENGISAVRVWQICEAAKKKLKNFLCTP